MPKNYRSDKLPPVPNDPAHPLRPSTFCWFETGHLDAATWLGTTYRDEFHRVRRIDRWPRRGRPFGMPRAGERRVDAPETVYIFDDEPGRELTYEQVLEIVVDRHGDEFHPDHIHRHPLVVAWRKGQEIPYTPSPPAFPVGSHVRRTHDRLPPELRTRFRERDLQRPPGRIVGGNALYVNVDWGNRQRWVAVSQLEAIDEGD